MKKNKETLSPIKKIWFYAKKYKIYIFMYILVILIDFGINMAVPIFSAKQVININNGLFDKLLIVSAAIFALETTRNIVECIKNRITQKFNLKMSNDIQRDLTKETLKLDIKEIDAHSSGIFIDRITKDANGLSNRINYMLYYVSTGICDVGVLFAILIVNKIMFIFCVFSLLASFWVSKIRTELWYASSKNNLELNEQNSGLIGELIRGIRDIKLLNISKEFLSKVIDKVETANESKLKIELEQSKYEIIGNATHDISNFLFIVLGIFLIKNANLTIENFMIIFMYQPRIYNLLYTSTGLNQELKNLKLSIIRIFEIMDGKFEKEKFGNTHLEKVEGNFEFKNVTFGYNKQKDVLKDMSFKVNANETVAFVGKSGEGKTTIFNLISRLYKVDKGSITIDGIDINKLDRNSIRDNISIITQSPYIFNFSIKENLQISKPDATEEEIIEACKIAQIHDYIMTLPQKYDTLAGEGGVNLSGGQRQRIAIARALLKKTEIILFDEATSALDNKTQKSIQTAINNMKGEYTILIIAHRLSTVINSDRILFVNNGKIEAEGTHEELLKTSPDYKELYQKK